MPTSSFTSAFDPHAVAILERAYEEAVELLGLPKRAPPDPRGSDHYRVAERIMALALEGVRDLNRLTEAGVGGAGLRQSA